MKLRTSEGGRALLVKPFSPGVLKAIERAVQDSKLGMDVLAARH